MKLPAAGVEYVTFTATADFTLDGTLEVFISTADDYPAVDAVWAAANWLTAETVVDDVHTRSFETLLAGSEVPAEDVPVGSTQVAAGTNYVYVRLTDTPEVIIRPAGRFTAL